MGWGIRSPDCAGLEQCAAASVYRQINQVRLHAQWDAMKEKILTPDVIVDYNRQHRSSYEALHERDASWRRR